MNSFNLIFRNVKKNMKDYMIYFLTLMISVSMFYAFNSVQSQQALAGLSLTKQVLSEQMGFLIGALSTIIAIVLGFLIVYANGYLLKRRKKELGIYTLLGMEKGKIARIFTGETVCVGIISLVCGLTLGLVLSQGLSLFSLRLFAADMGSFQMVFSVSAVKKTIGYFALIFLITMIFNVRTISRVKLIDLLTADRKNETLTVKNKGFQMAMLAVSVLCMAAAGLIFHKYGILPSKENSRFQIAVVLVTIGTVLFFYSVSAVVLCVMQTSENMYLKGLNAFLSRQIGSRIRTDYLVISVVCCLLTVAICGLTVGISTAFAMNEASKEALPFDLNVVAHVKICGETDIAEHLLSKDLDIDEYAKEKEQISIYIGDMLYEDVFEGQEVELWSLDQVIPECEVSVIGVSDYNKSLALQGKEGISLGENEFYLNCNYEGTFKYIEQYLKTHSRVKLAGMTLNAASNEVLKNTYWMTSVGNNDRGTFVVPDEVAKTLKKDANLLLVQYKEGTNGDEILEKMASIVENWEVDGYRYTEKNMLSDMYYGMSSLVVFLACYIGLIFLLICAVLLSLKQLTETQDNIYRYGLLQKLGVDSDIVYSALLKQVGIFFVAPLGLAAVFSGFGVGKIMQIVEEFMHLRISSNSWFTIGILLIVYGGYFMATYLSCKRIVMEKQVGKMEM